MKTAFLILGAQRSGTSVTSHVLSKFGIHFGSDQHFIRDLPVYFLSYEDLMINPHEETAKLAQHFKLDSNLVDHAAAVIDRSHYHQTATETGDALIDEYYQRLRSHIVSIGDPYESPLNPEVTCSTAAETIKQSIAKVMQTIFDQNDR